MPTFRSEMTNVFNLVDLSNPGTSASHTATPGVITTAGPGRLLQLGLGFGIRLL